MFSKLHLFILTPPVTLAWSLSPCDSGDTEGSEGALQTQPTRRAQRLTRVSSVHELPDRWLLCVTTHPLGLEGRTPRPPWKMGGFLRS